MSKTITPSTARFAQSLRSLDPSIADYAEQVKELMYEYNRRENAARSLKNALESAQPSLYGLLVSPVEIFELRQAMNEAIDRFVAGHIG